MSKPSDHHDVIIIGAGLSGVGAAAHLRARCPNHSFIMLEAREAIGGTWDLFRYPGVRSDSDMYTLGYEFKPWRGDAAIADGQSILDYIRSAADEAGVTEAIRFEHKVTSANWSSLDARWTVTVATPRGTERLTCSFLYMCTGYYRYDRAYRPEFRGAEDFAGRIVEPQFWPSDLDTSGQRIIVIGSGATAITLVPSLAATAAHVTMLQRSPTYILSRPRQDHVAQTLRKLMPERFTYAIVRCKNILLGLCSFAFARRWPEAMKRYLIDKVKQAVPASTDPDKHFTPRYAPWDQRLCVVPDEDLFAALKSRRASIVTDTIARFVPQGVELASGETLTADVVVAATGLELQLFGGASITIDGADARLSERISFQGLMLSGVPNLAYCFGYTNASWTLKADLAARYVCRILSAMKKHKARVVIPDNAGSPAGSKPFVAFSSGYVQRAVSAFPKQGSANPWMIRQNYLVDLVALRFRPLDRALRFSRIEDGRPATIEPATAPQ